MDSKNGERVPVMPARRIGAWRAGIFAFGMVLAHFAAAQETFVLPDMETPLFDGSKIELPAFEKVGLVGVLVAVARDFDEDDGVDHALRAHALAIAGRIDPENRGYQSTMDDLRNRGRTIRKKNDPSTIAQRIYSNGVRHLMKDEGNAANRRCAAYVADIALRLRKDNRFEDQLEAARDELHAAGITADWGGILGGPPASSVARPWEFSPPVAVTREVPMPGGTADGFQNADPGGIRCLLTSISDTSGVMADPSPVSVVVHPDSEIEGLLFTFDREVDPGTGSSLDWVVQFLQERHGVQPDLVPSGLRVELDLPDELVILDGQPAGVPLALLLDSLFTGEELDPDFSATGLFSPSGSVGKTSSLLARVRAASEAGCRIMGIPEANAAELADVIVMSGPAVLLELQVFGLRIFDDAHAISRKEKSPRLQETMDAFRKVATMVTGPDSFADETVQAQLERVLDEDTGMPNHLSASTLLAFGRGQRPATISAAGSLDLISEQIVSFRARMHTMSDPATPSLAPLVETTRDIMNRLDQLDGKIDPRLEDFRKATREMMAVFQNEEKNMVRIAVQLEAAALRVDAVANRLDVGP